MKSEILSVKEKIGYGMGDAASHIIFDNVMLYMMFFYTDIFGIPAGFVGTMFYWRVRLMPSPTLVWACWPTAPALAGANSDPGCCLARCRLVSFVCWLIARRISV